VDEFRSDLDVQSFFVTLPEKKRKSAIVTYFQYLISVCDNRSDKETGLLVCPSVRCVIT
jgi:hypothetical protein